MKVKLDGLVGRKWVEGSVDCYACLRDFYDLNFGIKLRNYARPTNWWNHGLDLYREYAYAEGFRPVDVHPREYRIGDVFAIQIRAKVWNHVAIYIGNGEVLHHFYGRFSNVELYKGIWRSSTIGVWRHQDLDNKLEQITTIDLMTLLPDEVRRKLESVR